MTFSYNANTTLIAYRFMLKIFRYFLFFQKYDFSTVCVCARVYMYARTFSCLGQRENNSNNNNILFKTSSDPS